MEKPRVALPVDLHGLLTHVLRRMDALEAKIPAVQGSVPGKNGEDGKDAVVDHEYIVKELAKRLPKALELDTEQIVQDVLALIPKPKAPKPLVIDHAKLAEKVLEELDGRLEIKHIKGLRGEIDSYRNQLAGKVYGRDTWARGGGDTVAAGSNITITTDVNGKKVISTSTGGFTVLTPTGAVNSSNLVFVFVQVPSLILSDGVMLPAIGNNGDVFWTIVGTTVTMVNPPAYSLFGIV